MQVRTALVVAVLLAAASAAQAGPTRHAGEWETVIDNGHPLIACLTKDETLDQAYVTRTMAKMPGAHCQVTNLSSFGPVTNFAMQCEIGGGVMTSSGTITQTGPESFSTKSHTHGGAIKLGDGRTTAFPDMDMVSVSHRLGPCKPGDRVVGS